MFSLVGTYTDIMDMLLGDNVSAPAFHTMGSVFDDAELVHKNFVIKCYIMLATDISIATYSLVTLPIKP